MEVLNYVWGYDMLDAHVLQWKVSCKLDPCHARSMTDGLRGRRVYRQRRNQNFKHQLKKRGRSLTFGQMWLCGHTRAVRWNAEKQEYMRAFQKKW